MKPHPRSQHPRAMLIQSTGELARGLRVLRLEIDQARPGVVDDVHYAPIMKTLDRLDQLVQLQDRLYTRKA